MGNILASLGSSASALNVIQQALGVVQNNVDNSSTPGYASQQLNIEALPYDVATGAAGGVASDGLIDSRDTYVDTAVQSQMQTLGLYTAQNQATGTIQSFFDVSGTTGVSAALSNLYAAFSAWSTTPSDPTAQQTVISDAGNVASSIQGLSNSLTQTSQQLGQQVGSTVSQINSLAAEIQQYNVGRLANPTANPGADAQLEANLESLSQLVNFTALKQADGTVTVLVGGGTPLVIGNQQYSLTAQNAVATQPAPANPDSPPTSQILDSQGNDITADITGGQLGGLLDSRNNVLGSIIGNAQQAGTLNQLASNLADTVNQILQSGTVSTASGAAAGTALFTYDNSDPTLAASTLAVNPAITGAELAPVDSSGNANGNANQLAALANPTGSQGEIDGMSYVQFFGQIAASVGQANQTAQNNQTAQQQVVTQAQTLQSSISGVSLDGAATQVLQLQNAYQAVSRVLTIINTLADSIMNLILQPQS